MWGCEGIAEKNTVCFTFFGRGEYNGFHNTACLLYSHPSWNAGISFPEGTIFRKTVFEEVQCF